MFLFSFSSSVPVILHLISTSGRFQPRCEADEDEDGGHNSSETREARGGRKGRGGSTQGVVKRYRLGLLFPRVFERPSTKCVFCSSSRLLLGGGEGPGYYDSCPHFRKKTTLLSRLFSQTVGDDNSTVNSGASFPHTRSAVSVLRTSLGTLFILESLNVAGDRARPCFDHVLPCRVG